MEAYCVKCREKVTIANPEEVTLKNGRPATKGDCSTPGCGTKVFRIGKAKQILQGVVDMPTPCS